MGPTSTDGRSRDDTGSADSSGNDGDTGMSDYADNAGYKANSDYTGYGDHTGSGDYTGSGDDTGSGSRSGDTTAVARPARHRQGFHAVLAGRRRRWLPLGGAIAAVVVILVLLVVVLSGGGGSSAPHVAGTTGPTAAASPQASAGPSGRWVLAADTRPLDGQSVSAAVDVTLNPGTDTLDKIERVKFSLDGNTVVDDREAPFTVHLDAVAGGKHTLTARVRTNTDSAEVTATFTSTGDGSTSATSAPAAAPTAEVPAAVLAQVPTAPAPLRTVPVSTADQLKTALAAAQPGDLIDLADGQYSGHFVASQPANAKAPITVRGSRNAVIDGGSIKEGYGFHLDNADYWRLEGFTIQNGQKGVMTDQTSGAVITGLLVRNVGDEAIHLRNFSTDNFVVGCTVNGTGRKDRGFGEGIYIGTAKSNWEKFSGGKPDNSDRNQIIGNSISGVTAEAVDIKEATTGGVLSNNSFDGSTITGANSADSWVDVKGNNWRIEGNRGVNSPKDGIQTHVLLDGWGTGNIITGNTLDVRGPGYGVSIDKPDRTRNTVSCSNTATAAASGLTNVTCTR
ncbi:right-handed parallel beta-helix repeat-containing protein [Frankia sp. Cr2]|uniref:right-handed parallel beta-helix repeat-containing protein n=1 Tax=Frankia sp. Cr2 TaxID=3073932 RepID=UPI002AD3891F|nr:right-handed parallel beta-helix repeat-containing protein [Frankia sp. Cr2]